MADTKIQDLANLSSANGLDRLPIVSVAGPTDNSITVANLRKSMVGSVSVPFTDGDSYRRVTVADTTVTATSKIIVTVQRPDIVSDAADLGYVYFANVVNRTSGVSFDVTIVCTDWGFGDPAGNTGDTAPFTVMPNETITLCYMIG